jgi:hypothetical protein
VGLLHPRSVLDDQRHVQFNVVEAVPIQFEKTQLPGLDSPGQESVQGCLGQRVAVLAKPGPDLLGRRHAQDLHSIHKGVHSAAACALSVGLSGLRDCTAARHDTT